MKIRLIISEARWTHQLRVKRDNTGNYYATLTDHGGQSIPHRPIIGGFRSLDWLLSNAAQIYSDLQAKLPTKS